VQLELQKRITDFPDLGIDEPEQNAHGIKIAQITFAFENSKVINWLKKRGTFIKQEKWDKLDEINKTIADSLREDHELLDKMQKPVSIFATFETEEGYSRAVKYNEFIK
jgi:hypothetical protein